jgi:hypothetical protein
VIEFRLNRITALAEANEFLPAFIKRYNKKFGVAATEPTSLFTQNTFDLINILCVREERRLDSGGAFSFHGQHFVIMDDNDGNYNNNGNLRPRTKIEVIVHRTQGIFALYRGQRFDVCRIDKPKRQPKTTVSSPKPSITYTPPDSHYHKRGKETFVPYSAEYTDAEVLAIIRDIFDADFKGNGMHLLASKGTRKGAHKGGDSR